ncbi:hypothetical protein TRIP_B10052 [uncultured Desulfatiglans sp.]|uniref:Uncharacterized protein n=1 Tax=Uncultured Desulfatiglans sp. TaxID=1748965 RepID=A0A652ZZZ5_UNCDX|nr:hypothetical protein TRIP_B10052 [uncultured Desulfatiglans sp.]
MHLGIFPQPVKSGFFNTLVGGGSFETGLSGCGPGDPV